MVIVMIGVTMISFILIKIAPGDPILNALGLQPSGDPSFIAEQRAKLGLDDPIPIQYGKFLFRLIQGDLGRSIGSNKPVASLLAEALPNTLALIFSAIAVAILVGIPMGVISAVKQGRKTDHAIRTASIFLASMPDFWLALVLILVFSYYLGLTPVSGSGTLQHLILPSTTLGLGLSGVIIRLTRSSLLEVLGQDYIMAAYARGLSYRTVLAKHALRNASIPIITVLGLQLGFLIAGAFFIEWVFGWPGIGRLAVQAINQRDFPVVMGVLLVTSISYVIINLVVDLVYAYVDPRIQYK